MNLSKEVKILRVEAATAAGTTDIDTAIVDTQGYDTVAFIGSSQAVASTAVAALKIQHGDNSALSDVAALEGSSLTYGNVGTANDSNTPFIIEATRPTKRYVRLLIDLSVANSAWGEVYCLLGKAKKEPVTQTAKTNLVATAGNAA
jgi:hypothetical protein